MEQEIWKDVKGYEGYYQISNHGQLKRLAGLSKCTKNGHMRRINENITYGTLNDAGYRLYVLCLNGVLDRRRMHRLVAEYFIPNPNNYKEVNHKDGNKENNHVSNLEWCTPKMNMRHSFENGLNKGRRGVKNKNPYILNKPRNRDYSIISKKVDYYLPNGVFVKRFSSITEAARELGTGTNRIIQAFTTPPKKPQRYIIKLVS